jgi:hypothetical protein
MSSPLEPSPVVVPVPVPESAIASKYQSAVDEVIALLIDRIKQTSVAHVEAEVKKIDVVAVKRCCLQWWGH